MIYWILSRNQNFNSFKFFYFYFFLIFNLLNSCRVLVLFRLEHPKLPKCSRLGKRLLIYLQVSCQAVELADVAKHMSFLPDNSCFFTIFKKELNESAGAQA